MGTVTGQGLAGTSVPMGVRIRPGEGIQGQIHVWDGLAGPQGRDVLCSSGKAHGQQQDIIEFKPRVLA